MEMDVQSIGKTVRCQEVKAGDEEEHIQHPAEINERYNAITDQLTRVNTALDCRDFGRSDFRAMRDGQVYFLEINPLPGLSSVSDLVTCARYAGISHRELVNMILYEGLVRAAKADPTLQNKVYPLGNYLLGVHKRLQEQTYSTVEAGGTSYKIITPKEALVAI